MIQLLTKVKVADNTGALIAKCIKVLGGSKKKVASVGDIVVLAVQNVKPNTKVKKGDVLKGVVIRVKKKLGRTDGSHVSGGDNAVVIINESGVAKGTRIFGPVFKELKKYNKKFPKIIGLASSFI